jgi:parallel beta-helix repeat protein
LGFAALSAALVSSYGCGDESAGTTTGTGGSTTSSGSGSTGSGAMTCADPKIDTSGCTTVLSPSSDDTTAVQTALIEVSSGSTVCLCPGSYSFTQQLSLTVPSVTVKGLGAAIDDTKLDFAGVKSGGNDTMLVTADSFTIENLAIKNTPGNGVVVRQADSPTFRKLHVSWDDPDFSKHGAYAVYPAECKNVLIEDCEVEGAADAAIYVGQGTGAILRRNKAHDSVLGIELENTTNGEAYQNEAYNNSGGIAVFLLANLNKKTADHNLVHDNNVHDNNHMNFGDPKTFVASVPVGTGVIVVGADDTEIRNNTISGNESVGILVVSYSLMEALVPGAMPDPGIDPYPERTFIHGNTLMSNGNMPQFPLTAIGTMLESVQWDGFVKTGKPSDNTAQLCLGSKSPYPTFRMFDGPALACALGGMSGCMAPAPSTDTTPYQCDLPEIPGSK